MIHLDSFTALWAKVMEYKPINTSAVALVKLFSDREKLVVVRPKYTLVIHKNI